MGTKQLAGLETLEQTPVILKAMLKGSDRETLDWKPAPERWSISEVLAHLADVEAMFLRRTRRMVEEENPPLEDYDPGIHEAAGAYKGKDPFQSLEALETSRAESLAFLKSLDEKSSGRTGKHAKLGEVTLGQLLQHWAYHDLGHIRQTAELYRAKVYYSESGPWQQYSKPNP